MGPGSRPGPDRGVTMADTTALFVQASRQALAKWIERVDRCLATLAPKQIWWRGQDNSNAIGNLLLHLAGNVRQWIVSGVGGVPDVRDRDAEFACREPLAASELRARLAAAVRDADAVLARLTEADLHQTRRIQVYDMTVLEAVHHVTEHFALHCGQILYATKLLTGGDLGFYKHLQKQPPGAAPPPADPAGQP